MAVVDACSANILLPEQTKNATGRNEPHETRPLTYDEMKQ